MVGVYFCWWRECTNYSKVVGLTSLRLKDWTLHNYAMYAVSWVKISCFTFSFQKYKIHHLNLVELTLSFIIIFFVAGKRGAEVTSTSQNKGTFSFWFYCCCNHQGFIFWPEENFIFLSKTNQEILSRQDYTVQVGI